MQLKIQQIIIEPEAHDCKFDNAYNITNHATHTGVG